MINRLIIIIISIIFILLQINFNLSNNLENIFIIKKYKDIKHTIEYSDVKIFNMNLEERLKITKEISFIKEKNQYHLYIKNYIDSCNVKKNIFLTKNSDNEYTINILNKNSLKIIENNKGNCNYNLKITINEVFKKNDILYLFDRNVILTSFILE